MTEDIEFILNREEMGQMELMKVIVFHENFLQFVDLNFVNTNNYIQLWTEMAKELPGNLL